MWTVHQNSALDVLLCLELGPEQDDEHCLKLLMLLKNPTIKSLLLSFVIDYQAKSKIL